MAEPNADLTAADSPASAVYDMAAEPAQDEHSSTRIDSTAQEDGEATPSQSHGVNLDENDSTPRSEAPSLPDAVTASLLSQMHPLEPEPSYFSPQPRRLYSSHLPRSTTASSEPSPTHSTNASATSISILEPSIAEGVEYSFARPAFQRDLSSQSTASNATVRANSVEPSLTYAASLRQQRDGPVYPNQSYAALHLQQHPLPHAPPIVRSRSSHPAHSAANSLSSLSTFGLHHEHYRDVMDSAPRTVGNSPVSSPGLFDPNNRRSQRIEQPNDGLYSSPWLHHMHRQAPKETHIADVQADPVSGRKIVNQYEIIDELGRGMHGKVKLGKELNKGHYVAIKIVDRYSKRRRLGKSSSHEDKIKREIAILKKARHPNIVSLLEVIDDPAKRKVYIVLEHVELGEVKWRTEGAREICLVEWRRFKRESKGIFDNESAAMEDERIIRVAHQKLAREQRRRAREAHFRRQDANSNEPWSFEFGGESEDEYSEAGRSSVASNLDDDRRSSRVHIHERHEAPASEVNMETAFRAPTPAQEAQASESTGLEGTMYGAYDSDIQRLRTPSIAGSNSSYLSDSEEDLPEHFRYVPLMTTQSAWEAFKDTVLGLEYLHYQNVYHRDIKPANLLVTREHRIKISDFGVSYLGRSKTDENNGDQSESEHQEEDEAVELAKTVGTPAFYAPELCRTDCDADTPKIDGGIDVWALGVTLYCLIYGRVPFHHDNPFTLMKVISEEEPYIPRYRLKPVAEHSNSRPNSHGRNSQPMVSSKRAPHDLEYEEVDERLRDLLKLLLVKDSRHRITIPEIKRHPWVLSGISNSNSWVEETDPGKSSQGRKIEISNEDLDKAVVPIGWVDRVRSTVKKGADFVTKSFTRSSGSRRRAQSSVANQDAPPSISANSSSSTISQDGRRGSLVPVHFLEAIRTSREPEHPLSHSVTASPEARERMKYFDSPNSRTASPAQCGDGQRPHMHDRAISSVHTIRHSDLVQGRSGSPTIPPALPGTPTALDSPGGSNLGGLFGGLPRRVVNSMRSKDKLRPPREHMRARSIDRLVDGDDDAHGMPSLAVSTSTASGHVDQPDALKDLSPVARSHSPSPSEARSHAPSDTASRQSSLSSMSSRLHRNWAHANDLEVGPQLEIPSVHQQDHYLPLAAPIKSQAPTSQPSSLARESSDVRFDRAKEELIRRRVHEATMSRERSNSANNSRPSTAISQTACPPSPDDEVFFQRQKVEDYLSRHDPSSENSPVGGQERGLAFCSSEEQFTPMSQSTSNPSIPSVASAGSSAPDECAPFDNYQSMIPTASAESFHHNQFDAPIDDPAGYDGDHAVDSEDEDSDDDDGGLFIGKRKPAPSHRSESISVAEVARSDIRKDVMHSRRRSARSGSNGTVKKIPPPGEATGDNTPEAT
ncbi:kinase-like protein [Setomelanomma holmii]|uniref:non-specific serine/threonine protein kinase n=1 Tax=Setomelanomma holmii TaxID=210430 RepID=A0A9P4HKT8_9PLEO|nr:kinase-like protein [Setomelanomma holmii]